MASTDFVDNTGSIDASWLNDVDETTYGFVNVKHYGAIGDGIIDDTSAIQSAFNVGGSIHFPIGTYKITGTLTITPPFNIIGLGAESTILSFDGMTAGTDGISIQQGGDRTISSIKDMTLQVKGSNGRYCITTPRGASIFDTNTPSYQFERLKFRGGVETATESLYDYGWSRYLDIGDGRNHVVRDVEIFGIYDYTVDPSTVTTDSTIGIYISANQAQGGVLTPIIDHVNMQYVGIAVQFQYRASNPVVINSQFHRCSRGVYGAFATVSASDYGVSEAQLHSLNINAQLVGVEFQKTSFVDISSVRVTRADGGFDHPNTWTGFKLEDVDEAHISGIRALNTGATYTNVHIGMHLIRCDFIDITGYRADLNLTRGIILEDSTRIALIAPTFKAPSVSSIYFKYVAIAQQQVSVIADKHTSTSTPYSFDASVNKESVQFIGGKSLYTGGVDASASGVTAAGGTDNIDVVNDSQIYQIQMNTSVANHTLDLQNIDAVHGDTFEFRIQMEAGFTGTLSITPDGGGAIWSKVGPGSAVVYIVEVVFTGADWILKGAYLSDA